MFLRDITPALPEASGNDVVGDEAPVTGCREPGTQPYGTPRVGPAWQTDNLQSSTFNQLLSFKGRMDVSLMRKLACQYVLNVLCLFLFPFPLKYLVQTGFDISYRTFLQFVSCNMSKHEVQTKLSCLKGDKGRELGEGVPQPPLWKPRLGMKKMWKTVRFDLGFCPQVRSY